MVCMSGLALLPKLLSKFVQGVRVFSTVVYSKPNIMSITSIRVGQCLLSSVQVDSASYVDYAEREPRRGRVFV